MRLPPTTVRLRDWPEVDLLRWRQMSEAVGGLATAPGRGRNLEAVIAGIKRLAKSRSSQGLKEVVATRIGATAFTEVLLTDEGARRLWLGPKWLGILTRSHVPRLGRLAILNLLGIYFRYFDHLDPDRAEEGAWRALEQCLLQQLAALPAPRADATWPDSLQLIKQNGYWLLDADGPAQIALRAYQEGTDLKEVLAEAGLSDIRMDRYEQVCLGIYYVKTVEELRPNEWDPVLDELRDPAMARAPYGQGQRIGHVVLATMIDRCGAPPSDKWIDFMLDVAGDPRIASRSRTYQEWWRPLGESRIHKVQGWLSKEDLKLFLRAVEQYGIEERNEDLQRMFPGRKAFLMGLYELGLVRRSRLMLGSRARDSVKRILGAEFRSSFAQLEGVMADRAAIYLDCGEFCIVEGSHNFKIWVYLAPPGRSLENYDLTRFSHADLTQGLPIDYAREHPGLPLVDVVHSRKWQWNVFDFLADNGVALDYERLMLAQDYVAMRDQYGLPVVNRSKRRRPPPSGSGGATV